jgi:O-antigen ligase
MYIARKTPQAEKIAMGEMIWASGFYAVIALMQVFRICGYAVSGVVGGWPSYWKQGIAVSTFNGHYEYGQFLCFAIIVFFCVFLRTRKYRYLLLAIGSCGMIWLTDSRSSLMVGLLMIVLILLFSIRKETKPALKAAAAGIILLAVGAVVLFLTGTVKVGRFSVVNLGEYAEVLRVNIENGDLHRYVTTFRNNEEFSGLITRISDGSATDRFYLWGSALDGFRHHPIFGYGAGVTHVTDGNYIRLLGENGIVGTVLYLSLLGYYMQIMRKERERIPSAKSVFFMILSLLFAAVFIDMFRASKPMETLWLAVGLVIGVSSLKSEENNHLSGERV